MEWARTLRIDAPREEAERRFAAIRIPEGVRASVGADGGVERTYVLFEGPQSIDPAQMTTAITVGRWFGEAILGLAIEPQPGDALPKLRDVLTGTGAPKGAISAEAVARSLVVELSTSASPRVALAALDVELRRWNGTRRTRVLSPLPVAVLAAIAAEGLQAPEIAPGRILESLLETAHVE